MPDLKAVFWDVDGTLADTEMYGHRIAFNKAFQDFNIEWDWNSTQYKDLLSIQGGVKRIKYFAKYTNLEISEQQAREIHHIKQKHYKKLVNSNKIPLRVGVERLIEDLDQNNVKQWIVSSSTSNAIDELIVSKFLGKSPFSGQISYEDVKKHKPNPEPYLAALKKCGVHHSECIVIEDSSQGVLSAIKAKLKCLATLSPWLTSVPQDLYQANVVTNHLGNINNRCIIYKGPKIEEGYINYQFLKSLILL